MTGDRLPPDGLPEDAQFFEVSTQGMAYAYLWAYAGERFYRWLIYDKEWQEVGGLLTTETEVEDPKNSLKRKKIVKRHGVTDSLKQHAARAHDWDTLGKIQVKRADPLAKPKPKAVKRLEGEQSLFGAESVPLVSDTLARSIHQSLRAAGLPVAEETVRKALQEATDGK
jgi:hypothetical protein